MNCHYLRHDADFVSFIKNKISEFKDIHRDTDCNPHVVWDAFKCSVTGHCIQYCSRKKKVNLKNKQEIQTKIDQINLEISNISLDDKQHLSDLIAWLDLLKIELNKIIDQETAGLIITSRVKWAEHGERSSRYFCNLEKRSNEKKNIHVLKNDTGSIVSDQKDILKEIHSFYKTLYTSKSTPNNKDNINSFLDKRDIPQFLDDSKTKLNRPISKAEIFTSLKSLNLNRSPGYDDLPAEFCIVFSMTFVICF